MLSIIKLVISISCLIAVCSGTARASGSAVRKFCSAHNDQAQTSYLLIASDIHSQQSALRRNTTLQEGKILFSRKEGDALFHEVRIKTGDCILLNLHETRQLEAVEVSPEHGDVFSGRTKKAPEIHRKPHRSRFLPAVFFDDNNTSKHYGLIEEKMLRSLTPATTDREMTTDELLNYATADDLVLIYIICPQDRNSLCDLSIKRNGGWLPDAETGKKFRMQVLARAQRKVGAAVSRRTPIDNDTPQGIYTIWGAVTDGGTSAWHRSTRIDLDAALPPMNTHLYNINSFLLSRIIPDAALDDYWVNEWPLAYSLGRVFLRIAPGDFEARQQDKSLRLTFGDRTFNPTHGCINTGDQQERLLRALVRAGVFDEHAVLGTAGGGAAKKWSVAENLGKAFVILKDRD